MYCAVAVNIRQKIKNYAFIYFSTQYMTIILQKNHEKQTTLCFSSFTKIKVTKSIGKVNNYDKQAPLNKSSNPLLSSETQCTTQYTYKVSSL